MNTHPLQSAQCAPIVVQDVDASRSIPERSSILIDITEVGHLLSISVSTIRRMMKDGTFPEGRIVGQNMRRWRRAEVDAWITEHFDA